MKANSATDPFSPANLTVNFVSAAAGSRKTLTAIAVALRKASFGAKIMFAVPTLKLAEELCAYAAELSDREYSDLVPVLSITSRDEKRSVVQRICRHVHGLNHDGKPLADVPEGGHLLFITHQALVRVDRIGSGGWPDRIDEWELIIDEEIETILTRQPMKLRESFFNLTQFVKVVDTYGLRKTSTLWTVKDEERVRIYQAFIDPSSNAAPAEVEKAMRHLEELLAKKLACEDRGEVLEAYYRVLPKPPERKEEENDEGTKPYQYVETRRNLAEQDDIYKYFSPLAEWLLQGVVCFTHKGAWDRMVGKLDKKPDRGRITIAGVRRPDMLRQFKQVTIMSALFEHTLLHDVWEKLGVRFVPSREIDVTEHQTYLGSRRLLIYYLTDLGWSKTLRDRSGGIDKVLQLIQKAGVINEDEPVCVLVNKDDGAEDNDAIVKKHFPNCVMMPHNSRGQNRFRDKHQLLYLAALNSTGGDIRWIEQALEIDSAKQRIARTGTEVYQTLMRLSLREPTETHDITLVVMDKDVAEWLVQWFVLEDQVEVFQIDNEGVFKRGKPGRPLIGDKPLTAAERKRRQRERKKLLGSGKA